MRVVILADGETPAHPVALAAWRVADEIVCCDGACAKAAALGRAPDFAVGDGDSVSPAQRRALGERFVRVAEQETNDLAKCLRFVHARHPEGCDLTVLGATGLREDHALANVFVFADFGARLFGGACGQTRKAPDDAPRLVTNAGVFQLVLPPGPVSFASFAGEPVSVFAPEAGTRAESAGLAWPLAGVDLAPLWKGALNRATGASFALASNRPLLVYRPHPSL